MCGWTNSIAYRGDDQNTEFDALQVTLAQNFTKGFAYTANYQWASAFGETSNFYTWSHSITHLRDSQVRDQQLTTYGSYDLPFGKGKQYMAGANHLEDLIVGGFQLSGVSTWGGGLPYTANYNECVANVSDTPNPATSSGCAPSVVQGRRMQTSLTAYVPNGKGTGNRTFYQTQVPGSLTNPANVAAGTGVFLNPGLDNFGNSGLNTYRGPRFFTTDLAITKSFSIWESVVTKFRMDAFNAFNHITSGNPSGNIESTGTISSEGGGCGVGNDCGPRQLEFSLRVQF
jgi:hypothetical protein